MEPVPDVSGSESTIEPSTVSIVYSGQYQHVPYRKPFARAGDVPTGPETLVFHRTLPVRASRETYSPLKSPK